MSQTIERCAWVTPLPLEGNGIEYHDQEWGVPSYDDVHLFEMLTLEGAQAGLSWQTVLNKRPGYRKAFAGFDAQKVARMGPSKIERLLKDPGIVRNRLKVQSTVNNARAVLKIKKEFGSLSNYLWGLSGGGPVDNAINVMDEVPAETDVSRHMSRELKGRGFKFVGPTICYAFMQAVGMVNDHERICFRYAEIIKLSSK